MDIPIPHYCSSFVQEQPLQVDTIQRTNKWQDRSTSGASEISAGALALELTNM